MSAEGLNDADISPPLCCGSSATGLQEIARYSKFSSDAIKAQVPPIGWSPPLAHDLNPKQKSFTYLRRSTPKGDRGFGKRRF